MAIPSTDLSIKRFRTLQSNREPLNNVLERIAENFYPERKGFQSTQTLGGTRRDKCFDSAPYIAMNELASSIESMLMPKDTDWFDVVPEDENLVEEEGVKEFLKAAKKRLYDYVYNPRSGFLNMTASLFPDLISFGYSPIYAGRNVSRNGVIFKSFHPKDMYWTYGEDGRPRDTYLVREKKVSELIDAYGAEKLHPECVKAFRDGQDPSITILHAVELNENFDKSGRADRMKYKSKVIDLTYEHVIHTGGYKRNWYMAAIWQRMNNDDFWSPGRFALPDVMVLNTMGKTILEAGHFKVRPPILVPSDGITSVLSLIPGGVSSYNSQKFMDGTGRGIIEKVDISGDLPFGLDMQEQRRMQIGKIFMEHILKLPEKYMSATEVHRYNDDLSRIVNSPFTRLETNLSEPIMANVLSVMIEDSADMGFAEGSPLPLPPEVLGNSQLKFKFRSPIRRAKEMALVARFAQTVEMLTPVFNIDPSAMAHINTHDIVRRAITGAVGYDSDFLRDKGVVEKEISDQKSMEEVGQMASVADIGSRAAKNASTAELNSAKAAQEA